MLVVCDCRMAGYREIKVYGRHAWFVCRFFFVFPFGSAI